MLMSQEEQDIARIVLERAQAAGKTVQHRYLARVREVVVRLRPDKKSYDYVSGPEYHTVGQPRRRRLVWSVRYDVRDGVAYGGWTYELTKEGAIALLRPSSDHRADWCAAAKAAGWANVEELDLALEGVRAYARLEGDPRWRCEACGAPVVDPALSYHPALAKEGLTPESYAKPGAKGRWLCTDCHDAEKERHG